MFILTMADGRKGEGLSAGVVCWVKFVAWVKGIGDGVWSVGSSLLRGSKELSAACGLSGQVWQVGQENCRRRLVCRGEKGEWVKRTVGGVWSVGAKTASEPKKPHISYASNVANRHSDQNCQNPQNMIHLL